MESWHIYLLVAVGTALLMALSLRSRLLRRKRRKQRDFTRKLEMVLQPKETVKTVCPQKRGTVILTNKRLLFETPQGFTALPLTRIKKLQGLTREGKSTVSPPKMEKLIIKSEKDYTLTNTGPEFLELAKGLKGKKK